jgi:deferrochelatase/peroxidase EfeB
MKSSERELMIAVKGNNLNDNDSWIRNGTYMTFMRFNIDVENWYDNEVEFQERIVGIDKETGCPIVGIQDGKNLIAPGCPVPNTDNVTQYGNDVFRDSFANPFSMYNRDSSIKHLDYSHVKQMIDGATQTDSNREPSRIFRQGYEFLEPTGQSPYFRAGLNFISFQSSPQKILNLLTYGFIKKDELVGKDEDSAATLGDFVSVDAAGIYLVPPSVDKNQFPGKVMFLP